MAYKEQLPLFVAWGVEMFGPIAEDPRERGLRLLEEVLEAAQSVGVEREVAEKLVERVYSRPPGSPIKELGQARLCLDMLAVILGLDAEVLALAEWDRVRTIPKEEWVRRHAAKVAIGVAS